MTAHLIESTLLLGVAIAAAHLPRLAARTRYAIVFLALVKFAVPWKFEPPRGTIAITIPGPIAAAPRAFVAAPSIWPLMFETIWIAVAVALFALIVFRGRRAVADALDGAVPAPEREQAMLPRRDVVLLRSPGAVAPAAIGIVRSRIVLPAALALDDGELAAILAHECAHVARRDNLLALVDAALGAALWFHPLVWIARRILARAREEACDESVVARSGAEVYAGALAKVCCAAAAPRVAGVSCIVSNNIRERMNAIMALPRPTIPHRFVVAVAVALLAAVTLVHAGEGKENRYLLKVGIDKAANGDYVFDVTVVDRTTHEVVAHPKLQTAPDVPAELTTDGTPALKIRALGDKSGHAEVSLQAIDGGNVVDAVKSSFTIVTKSKTAQTESSSQKISIHFKDADLKDIIEKFGAITNLETQIDPDVEGKVTVELHDVPWDQALQRILSDNGCDYAIEGHTLHVRRIR